MEHAPNLTQERLAMYQLLAHGFSYPTEAFFLTVKSGAYEEHLRRAAAALGLELDQESGREQDQDQESDRTGGLFAGDFGSNGEEMMSEYLKAFELNLPRKSCSLYAGSHLPGTERGSILLSVRQIYSQFDVAPDPEQAEPADFLVTELEFMQFLLAKELQARELQRDARPYCWAQGDFLRLHLAHWIPSFAETVEALIAFPFYRRLAAVLDRFIRSEDSYMKYRMQEIGPPPDPGVPSP